MADPNGFDQLFEAAGQKYDVDPRLLKSVALTESGLNPFTRDSEKGARGMMQFMPTTAARFGIDPYDPAGAIDAAAKYLSQGITKHGSVAGALGDYYGAVDPSYIGKVASYYGDKRSALALPSGGTAPITPAQANTTNAQERVAGNTNQLPVMPTHYIFGTNNPPPGAGRVSTQGQMGDIFDDLISGKLDSKLRGAPRGNVPAAGAPGQAPQISTSLPPGTVQPALSDIDQQAIMKTVDTANKRYDGYVNSVGANGELEANLRNAAEAFRYFNSGVGTELGANVARFMSRIGVDPKNFNLADAAQVQSAKKSAALAVQAMMGKASDPLVAQWATAEHATPNPSLEPNAVKDLLAGGLARIARTQDVAQSMQNYLTQNNGSLRGFDLVSTEASAGKNMPYYQRQALESLPDLAGEDKAMPPAMVLSAPGAAPTAPAAPAAAPMTTGAPASAPSSTPAFDLIYNPKTKKLEPAH